MNRPQGLTRRKLFSNLTAAAGVSLLPYRLLALQGLFPTSGAIEEISLSGKRESVTGKFQPFPMTQVRLRPGPFEEAMEINRRYLHSLPNDRLLHMFRVSAGIPSSAAPLRGWEEPKCELRGHFTGGHYLSACALNYSSTWD